jgi:lytic murein transglycosylase
MRFFLPVILTFALCQPLSAQSTTCGGNFSAFVNGLKSQARKAGHKRRTVNEFFKGVVLDERTLAADRAQGIFTRPFTDFSGWVISDYRMNIGAQNARKWDGVFDRIEARFGVSRGVLLALWALETDFGANQGDFNTLNSLVTLAHDCRRPELFRPQIFAALALYESGSFDPATTKGAWAGEIGMVQMLPEDIIHHGHDADGDGRVDLQNSVPDALTSGAAMLTSLGWRAGEPWIEEAVLPRPFDPALSGLGVSKTGAEWSRLGVKTRTGNIQHRNLEASIILPEGTGGPAFIIYPNFHVFFEWNQSFTYVTAAAYFATRLQGAPAMNPGSPQPGLAQTEMKALQRKLQARGHDVGKIDGILGAGTRAAVRAEQSRLGLPVDGWPTAALLRQL